MELIESKTLISDAANIEFTSIPQTYTDLFIVCSIRTSRNIVVDSIQLRPNGLAEGSTTRLFGSNNASDTVASIFGLVGDNQNTANTFGSCQFYVFDYTSNSAKSISVDSVQETNQVEAYRQLSASTWSGTLPITSIIFAPGTGPNLVAGCSISIYGINKGSDGITTVS